MTVRYLRLLISDKVIAKCVIKSLPLGVREKPASTQNIPIKKRLSSRFCLRQKRSPIQYLHSKLKNFAVPRCLEKEKSTQVKPAAESEKCPSNNEDQSPPDSTEEEFPQPEVVLAGSVVSKTCQIPDQMQAEPITATLHQDRINAESTRLFPPELSLSVDLHPSVYHSPATKYIQCCNNS